MHLILQRHYVIRFIPPITQPKQLGYFNLCYFITMNITIFGTVAPKKNSRQVFVKNGKQINIPSKRHQDWEKDALLQLAQYKGQAEGRVMIDYMFYVPDNRRRDLTNMIQSVEDLIVKRGLIKDDAWQYVAIGSANAEIDRSNPRVEFSIHELE